MRQSVPTVSDHHRQIRQHPAGSMAGRDRLVRVQQRGGPPGRQPGVHRQLSQQQRAGPRHQPGAVRADLDPSHSPVTLHLRSAFLCGGLGPSQAQVSLTGQALPCIWTPCRERSRERGRLACPTSAGGRSARADRRGGLKPLVSDVRSFSRLARLYHDVRQSDLGVEVGDRTVCQIYRGLKLRVERHADDSLFVRAVVGRWSVDGLPVLIVQAVYVDAGVRWYVEHAHQLIESAEIDAHGQVLGHPGGVDVDPNPQASSWDRLPVGHECHDVAEVELDPHGVRPTREFVSVDLHGSGGLYGDPVVNQAASVHEVVHSDALWHGQVLARWLYDLLNQVRWCQQPAVNERFDLGAGSVIASGHRDHWDDADSPGLLDGWAGEAGVRVEDDHVRLEVAPYRIQAVDDADADRSPVILALDDDDVVAVAVWALDPLADLDLRARVEGRLDLGYELLVLKA